MASETPSAEKPSFFQQYPGHSVIMMELNIAFPLTVTNLFIGKGQARMTLLGTEEGLALLFYETREVSDERKYEIHLFRTDASQQTPLFPEEHLLNGWNGLLQQKDVGSCHKKTEMDEAAFQKLLLCSANYAHSCLVMPAAQPIALMERIKASMPLRLTQPSAYSTHKDAFTRMANVPGPFRLITTLDAEQLKAKGLEIYAAPPSSESPEEESSADTTAPSTSTGFAPSPQ